MDFNFVEINFKYSCFVCCSFDAGQPFFTHVLLPDIVPEPVDDKNHWFLGALR